MTNRHAATAVITRRPGQDALTSIDSYLAEVLSVIRPLAPRRLPGMPQGFGTVGAGRTPIITLPGNPVSAFVSFRLFVRPAVRALQGLVPREPPTATAVLTAPLRSPAGKRSFICGFLNPGQGTVTPAPGRSSHQLTALSRANALIIVPEHVTALSGGDAVDVLSMAS